MFGRFLAYVARALHAAQGSARSKGAAAGRVVTVAQARERFRALCHTFATEFLPYASKCIHAVLHQQDGTLLSYVRYCVCVGATASQGLYVWLRGWVLRVWVRRV